MLERTDQAWSLTPRTTTFATAVGLLGRGSGTNTYTSGLSSGRPSVPVATCGDAASTRAASRPMPLASSESAPLRSTSALRSEPVRASAARNPCPNASMPMKTATTSAIPTAVNVVETGRCIILRAL